MIRALLLVLILVAPVFAQEAEPPWAAEHKAGDAARAAGDFKTALDRFRKAYEIAVKTEGQASTEAAYELWAIAECHMGLEEYAEAEQQARRVLSAFEEAFGATDSNVGEITYLIASACRNTGRFEEARRLFAKAHRIRSAVNGPAHVATLQALWDTAGAEYELGRYEPAVAKARQILDEYEKLDSPDPEKIGLALNLRGVCLSRLGRFEEALPDYRRALEIRIEQCGRDHPWTASAENNMGGILRDLERYEEAEKHYLRSIEIYRSQPGEVNPWISWSLNGMAIVRQKQGRLDEAERLCREALAIREEKLPAGHKYTGGSLVTLAEILHDRKRYAEAEENCERAFDLLAKAVVSSHGDFPRVVKCWKAVLTAQGRAEGIAEVDLKFAALGEREWQEVRRVAGLAEVAKDLTKAEAEWRRAIKVAGVNEARLRTACAGLGRTLAGLGKHRAAIPHYERAAELYRKTPDEDEFARVRNLIRLVDALDAVDRRAETAEYLREALPYLKKAHDAKSAWALEGFVAALAADGKWKEALPLAEKLDKGSRVRTHVLLLAGRLGDAEQGYRLAIEKDRTAGRPWIGIARIRQSQGRLDEAEIYARKGIALSGETASSLKLLAEIVEGLGRTAEAGKLRAKAARGTK